MWIALFLLSTPQFSSGTHAQSQPTPTISIDAPDITLKNLAAELTKQSKIKIEANGDVIDDRLTLSVAQVPLVPFLRRLAAFERGTLETTPQGYIIEGSKLNDSNAEQAVESVQTARVREAIQALTQSESSGAPARALVAADANRLANLERRASITNIQAFVAEQKQTLKMPLGQALILGLTHVPMHDLAMLGNDTVEWSTHPIGQERQWPGDVNELLKNTIADEELWKPYQPQLASNTLLASGIGWQPNRLSVLTLQVEGTGPWNPSILVTVRAFDGQGNLLASLVQPIDRSGIVSTMSRIHAVTKTPPDWQPVPPFLSTYLALETGEPITPQRREELQSKEFLKIYLHPEIYHPDGYLPGLIAIDYAKAKGLSLVAKVKALEKIVKPDSKPGFFDASSFERNLLSPYLAPFVTSKLSDGWLEVQSGTPLADREEQYSNRALGELIRTAVKNGAFDLDSVAAYAASSPGHFPPQYPQYFSSVFPHVRDQQLLGGNWPILGIYGSLTPTRRDEATSSGIDISSLPRTFLKACHFAMEGTNLEDDNLPKLSLGTDYFVAVPDGLPGGGILTLAPRRPEPVVYSATEHQTLTATDLARNYDEFAGETNGNVWTYLKLYPMTNSGVLLTLHFPSGAYQTFVINLFSNRPLHPIATFDQLPENFKQAFSAAREHT